MRGRFFSKRQKTGNADQAVLSERKKAASAPRVSRGAPASLTVECALVLPLYFMLVVTLLTFFTAIKEQTKEELRLSDTARKAAAAAFLTGYEGDMDLRRTVRVPFPVRVLQDGTLNLAARAFARPWTGYDRETRKDGDEAETERLVYVTEYRSVYHLYSDCTHLELAVYRTTTAQVKYLRNAYGERYKKCSGFPKGYTGDVYVTERGDRYYPSEMYAGLTRHVRLISEKDAAGLCLCERCAERRDAA